MTEKIDCLLKNVCPTIGEGPHWDRCRRELAFVDILSGSAFRCDADGHGLQKVSFSGKSLSVIVPIYDSTSAHPTGDYVATLQRQLVQFQWADQNVLENPSYSVLAEVHSNADKFNDGKCDSTGRLWTGTMGLQPNPNEIELHMGSLYSLERGPEFKLRKHFDNVDISNGLAWTADNSRMFYIDSIPRVVYSFNFDHVNGDIAGCQVAIDFKNFGSLSEYGLPDGMAIDTNNQLWIACYSAGKVLHVDPVTGKLLRELHFPQSLNTTSCCFGGADLSDLYVTSAARGVSNEELRTSQPLAGSVFKVTGLGARGAPVAGFGQRLEP